MQNTEKSILRGIYIVTIIMFLILSISNGSFDIKPLIVAIASCVLVGYGHFIIKRFFPDGDKYLLIVSCFIAQYGLVMIYRLNMNLAIKQLTWFAISMAMYIFIVILLPDLKRFSKYKNIYIIIAIILLGSTLVLGRETKGSYNWITFGPIGFQPSEIAKLFLILYLAAAIQSVEDFKSAIRTALPVFIAIGLLVIEKDLGAALIFFGIFITMLYIGTSNLKYILMGSGVFGVGGVISYFLFGHVRTRFYIWLNPWKYEFGKGYQICQSLFAIAAGGLFGTGLGLGHPEFISEVHNDFIFAAICEEFGILGALALILMYLLLVYRGLRVAIYADDDYSRLVAVGISSMIAFQVFVIIGGVTKMIPLTGITLPFVSYGGSSMLLNFISLGVLQRISELGGDEDE